GDPRLVAVRRRETPAVVDDDEVAEAVVPARVDDGSGGRRADRRAVAGSDVEAVVEAPPARPEPARDRPRDGPDEAARRRRRVVAGDGFRAPDLRLERDVGGLQVVDLVLLAPLALREAVEIGPMARPLLREPGVARDQLVAELSHLAHPEGDDACVAEHPGAHDLRLRELAAHSVARAVDRRRDQLVLLPDLPRVV